MPDLESVTLPSRFRPYVTEFCADTRTARIQAAGSNQTVIDQVSAMTDDEIMQEMIRESIIRWKTAKNAASLRADLARANERIDL